MRESPSSPLGTIDEDLRRAFWHAQTETIAAVSRTVAVLEDGMSELDVAHMLEAEVANRGFVTWFQRPRVQFGAPARPRLRMQANRRLQAGTLVEIDLAPANADAYGDFTTTIAFGMDQEPALLHDARELCRSTCGFASRWKCTGELFVYADAWANNHRASLGGAGAIGHVCLPRRGRTGWAWPYVARAAIQLKRHQVEWFNHRRMHGFYALAPRIVRGEHGIAFGEMVFIDGDQRLLVARENPSEIGTLPPT